MLSTTLFMMDSSLGAFAPRCHRTDDRVAVRVRGVEVGVGGLATTIPALARPSVLTRPANRRSAATPSRPTRQEVPMTAGSWNSDDARHVADLVREIDICMFVT